MRSIIIIFGLIISLHSIAEKVAVSLYSDIIWKDGMVKLEEGKYSVLGDGRVVDLIDASLSSELIYFSFVKGKIKLTRAGKSMGSYEYLTFQHSSDYGSFRIRVNDKERIYPDDLIIQVFDAKPLLINKVDMERYVAGVVESESGHLKELEYLKAQAVIARTYVMAQMQRYTGLPYDLCDIPKCQAYYSSAYGRNGYPIYKAVYATRGIILVDKDQEPITAAFHANSGGFTANSEDAWSSEVPYLRAVRDTFSMSGPSASWEKELDVSDWLAYLAKSSPTLLSDSSLQEKVMNFTNPDRNPNLNVAGVLVPFKELRTAFNLRSAYFDVFQDGDKILLKGRGYGHGVGLSQDGARNMAVAGYRYDEILAFYYKGVTLQIAAKS